MPEGKGMEVVFTVQIAHFTLYMSPCHTFTLYFIHTAAFNLRATRALLCLDHNNL